MAYDRLSGRKTLKVEGVLEELEKDEIKGKVDIVGLFESFGVKLSQRGKGYAGLCPWHEDHEPSLSVDREKGLYHCFGCGESGDVVDLVEKMKGLGFREALEYLMRHATHPQRETRKKEPAKETPKAREPETPATTVVHPDFTLTTVTDYYHKRLAENKDAQEYLLQRGIRAPEFYRRYKIGFAHGGLSSILSNGQKGHLKNLGIIGEKGGEHFYRCITVPIFDEAGQTVGLYGRKIDPNAKIKHLYLPGKHHGIFNRTASGMFDEIILTESIIDALSLIELGFPNVQALYGLNGFTEEHLALLTADRVKTVVLGFDNDEAGRKGAEKLKEQLVSEGFAVKLVFPPSGKDWNEYLLQGPDADALKAAIAEAEVFQAEAPERAYELSKDGPIYHFRIDPVSYRVQGVREIFLSDLRVNIKAEYGVETFYDKLDLYSSRSRTAFSLGLSQLFDLEPKRIEKDLVLILECLEEERDGRLTEETKEKPVITEEERRLGMEFLRSSDLFEQIVTDMEVLGYVGEDLNKQLVYIAASSRKLDDPISILILSQSAAGKSLLVDTVKRLMPEEDVISVTSLSDQALNYIPARGLLRKFLILGEAVHSEVIEHQIREMLSGHQLSRMVTIKDEKTGKMVSQNVKSEVIVSAVMSSTSYEVNPENASRCFLVNADESGEQTTRIHQAQRDKYSLSRYYERKHKVPEIVGKHIAAQRLLRNILIINPFGRYLDFPASLVRTRRDHDRFIDLIACVCFLRQFQTEDRLGEDPHTQEHFEYVECDVTDYRIAYRIMVNGVLSSTFAELPKSVVAFYEELRGLFHEAAGENDLKPLEVSLSQREIRKRIKWIGSESVKKYLRKLAEYEYLQVAQGGSRGMRNSYRLVADEPMERLDYSMIPSPEEIEKRMK